MIDERMQELEKDIETKNDAPSVAPEETPQEEAAQPETVAETTEESAPSEKTDHEKVAKKRDPIKRINTLTRQKTEIERERDYWRNLVTTSQAPTPQPTRADPLRAPTPDQFADQQAYLDARTSWGVNQRLAELQLQVQHQQEVESQTAQQAAFQKRIAAFEQAHPGEWEEITQAPINTTDPMLEVIASSEIGPEIALYLKNHLEEAAAISQMRPIQAAAALGRIESTLSGGAPIKSAKSANITRAPAIGSTLSAVSAGRKSEVDKSMEELIADQRNRHKR